MVKYLFPFLLLLLLTIGCGGKQIISVTPTQRAQDISSKTVALVYTPQSGDHKGETHPFCTGVWVSKIEILTAAHCVQGLADIINNEIDQQEPDPEAPIFPHVKPFGLTVSYIVQNEVVAPGLTPTATHTSIAVYVSASQDLAVLKITSAPPLHGIAQIAANSPIMGEHIVIIGHPRGFYWTYIEGTVTGTRSKFPQATDAFSILPPFLQFAAPIDHGNSGGGGFNQEGQLVGIVSIAMPTPDGGLAIHLSTIRGVLIGQHIIPAKINPNNPDPKLP